MAIITLGKAILILGVLVVLNLLYANSLETQILPKAFSTSETVYAKPSSFGNNYLNKYGENSASKLKSNINSQYYNKYSTYGSSSTARPPGIPFVQNSTFQPPTLYKLTTHKPSIVSASIPRPSFKQNYTGLTSTTISPRSPQLQNAPITTPYPFVNSMGHGNRNISTVKPFQLSLNEDDDHSEEEEDNGEEYDEYTDADYANNRDDKENEDEDDDDEDDMDPETKDKDSSETAKNPLNFLNLLGTDFQPGRLVNIFFGLFIMLFMMVAQGYAMWVFGIAFLPGTRALQSEWNFDVDKAEELVTSVIDALDYWEDKIKENEV